jgi:effector-binding domain-containing protein
MPSSPGRRKVPGDFSTEKKGWLACRIGFRSFDHLLETGLTPDRPQSRPAKSEHDAMIDTPQIAESPSELTAIIRMTVPREEIRNVMGPGMSELLAAVSAQGIGPAGPLFSHHLRMDPKVFDFEIGVKVTQPVEPVGRVKGGQLPAATVARTVYHGPYEGLAEAWGEFEKWISANGHAAAADIWERYVKGPESDPDPANWCTELNHPLVR